jgi:hypothetical protein
MKSNAQDRYFQCMKYTVLYLRRTAMTALRLWSKIFKNEYDPTNRFLHNRK